MPQLLQRARDLSNRHTLHLASLDAEYRELGQLMRQHRKAQSLSLHAMASLLGIAAPYLSDMERGRRRYLDKHILAASTLLQLP